VSEIASEANGYHEQCHIFESIASAKLLKIFITHCSIFYFIHQILILSNTLGVVSRTNFYIFGVLYYRLVGEYMRQPRLMKTGRTVTYKNCLSSDIVSIAFTYFLNSANPSLKYHIQFFKIDTPQNLLQALKKLVLVSQPNPFDFFFDCRKQVEVTRG
jgi:hypothetical protein